VLTDEAEQLLKQVVFFDYLRFHGQGRAEILQELDRLDAAAQETLADALADMMQPVELMALQGDSEAETVRCERANVIKRK
jgi:hypothetical protein